MRNKTVEEVYVEMLKPKDGVRLKVQYRPEEFTKVKSLPGDSFYIRYRGPGEGPPEETVAGECLCNAEDGTAVRAAWAPDHVLTACDLDTCDLGKLCSRPSRAPFVGFGAWEILRA